MMPSKPSRGLEKGRKKGFLYVGHIVGKVTLPNTEMYYKAIGIILVWCKGWKCSSVEELLLSLCRPCAHPQHHSKTK
jgi:hypothetical protein